MPKKIKIAIIGAKGYPIVYGGYDTFVKELSERLVKRGVEVTIYNHRSLFKDKPRYIQGIKLYYIPAIETKALTQLSHSFLSFIHSGLSHTDIILAVNPANGPFGILAKLFGKKCMINMDGMEWDRPKWKGFGARYFYFAARMATKLYDRIINDSEEMRKTYWELFGCESKVIAYGAAIRYSERKELIKKWDLKPEKYYLVVGRMIPDNNLDLIINGFMLSETKKNLVIVGDSGFKDDFAKNIRDLGGKDSRIIFTGYVTDQNELAELYHNSYVYIHGHEFGGTNPTLVKALAYGCAILALDTRFSREVLQDERFGKYFGKSNEDITAAIQSMEQSPKEVRNMKGVSRNGIIAKYDWDNITDQYVSEFMTLIGHSSREKK